MKLPHLSQSRFVSQLRLRAADAVSKGQSRFSLREQLLIVGGTLALLFVIGVKALQVIQEKFTDQVVELTSARTDIDTARGLLKSYTKLLQQRNIIETKYRKIEFRDGPLSYLESLITSKLNLPSKQFTIDPRPVQPFGAEFEQSSFALKFRSNSLEKLVSFLESLGYGEQPMIVTKLEMARTYSGDALDVLLEVSSIHSAGKGSAPTSPGQNS